MDGLQTFFGKERSTCFVPGSDILCNFLALFIGDRPELVLAALATDFFCHDLQMWQAWVSYKLRPGNGKICET